jgi:hypothetical protein
MTSVSRRIRSIGRRHGADFWFIASVGCLFASKPRFFSIFVEKMAIFGEKARPAGSRLTCYDYQTAKQACHVSSDQERARCQQLRSVVDFLVSAEEYSTRPTKAQQLELIVNAEAVSHWGVTTVEDVAAQVSASSGTQIKTDFAKKMLERQPGFSWLDEETGWFWIKTTSRNSLLTQIEKVLSVCSRIHISELREGVSRHHRREGFAPPQRVLLALCNQTGKCKVEENFVAADPPFDYKEILSEAEQIIVEVLMENGCVMERQKLEDECLARGIKRDTFYVYLTYSPALTRFPPKVFLNQHRGAC